jgi:DNA-binding response OmpR family regulator
MEASPIPTHEPTTPVPGKSFSRFQKLQELLIVTPVRVPLHVEAAKSLLPIATEPENTVVVHHDNASENTLFQQVQQHQHYMRDLIGALQNDEVISLRMVHPLTLESLEPHILASLPDAVLIDTPGYDLKGRLAEWQDDKARRFMTQSFQADGEVTPPTPLDLTRCIRQWSVNEGHRSVVLNLSQADAEEDRIQYLVNGADELLDTQMSSDELCVRILSHIRRHLDQYQFPITRQPNGELLQRMFLRRLRSASEWESSTDWSVAVFYVEGLNNYGMLYGQEAKVQMLQNLGALLGQLLHVPDWVFHLEESLFVALSVPERLERIMPIVVKRLETTCQQFLSKDDVERGFFMINQGALKVKAPLLRVGVGVLSTRTSRFYSLDNVLGAGLQLSMRALKQNSHTFSEWMKEVPLLAVQPDEDPPATDAHQALPYVVVVEPDAALAFLLQQTISMNGFEVEVFPGVEEALEVLNTEAVRMPQALIVDPFIEQHRPGAMPSTKTDTAQDETPWQALNTLRERLPGALILATANRHGGETPLIQGANAFLPKPYQLLPLLTWLDEMLKPLR